MTSSIVLCDKMNTSSPDDDYESRYIYIVFVQQAETTRFLTCCARCFTSPFQGIIHCEVEFAVRCEGAGKCLLTEKCLATRDEKTVIRHVPGVVHHLCVGAVVGDGVRASLDRTYSANANNIYSRHSIRMTKKQHSDMVRFLMAQCNVRPRCYNDKSMMCLPFVSCFCHFAPNWFASTTNLVLDRAKETDTVPVLSSWTCAELVAAALYFADCPLVQKSVNIQTCTPSYLHSIVHSS